MTTPDATARRRLASVTAAAIGVLVAVGALVAVPLVELVRVATEDGAGGIRDSLRAPGAPAAIVHTLVVAVAVTVLAVTGGTVAALAIERRSGRTRTLLRLLVAAPLVIPEFALGFAWSQAYGPAGLTDRAIHATVPGLLGPAGIVIVLTVHTLPLAYLAVTAGLAAHADPDTERAARVSGASAWTALRTVTLPLMRTPLIAAAVLVFVSAVGAFAVPQVLGTPAGYATMSTLVYQDLALSAAPQAFRDLTAIALLMTVVVLLAVGSADLRSVASRPLAARQPAGGRSVAASSVALVSVIVAYSVVSIGVPMAALILAAITRAPGLSPTPANWTFTNVTAAFAGPTGAAIVHTLELALVVAVVVPLLGTLVSLVGRTRARVATATTVTLAFAVPGSALAVGVLIGYGRWLTGSIAIILIAYVAKFWVLGHRPVQAGVDRLPPDTVRAARASGAGPTTATVTVLLPAVRVALITASALAFLFATHELTMSTILYGPGSETFAVVVLGQQDLGNTAATAALAVALTLPAAIIAAVLFAATRAGRSPTGPI